MSLTTLRQPAGIPVGGQFAAHSRSESSVGLPVAPSSAHTPLSAEEALAVARLQARKASRHVGVDTFEDFAQAAILSNLVTMQNPNSPVKALTPGVLTTAAKHAVYQALNDRAGIRHEDAAARKRLVEKVEAAQADLGRMLTETEVADLADLVRDTWHDPRHKPSDGFHLEYSTVSMDGDPSVYEQVTSRPATDVFTDSSDDAELDDYAHQLETKQISPNEARRQLWNTMADRWDVPLVTRGRIPGSHVRVARATTLGRVTEIAAAYLDGETNASTDALLALWPDATTPEKYRIASKFAGQPAIADKLWGYAAAYVSGR